jgi:hypothetical protein
VRQKQAVQMDVFSMRTCNRELQYCKLVVLCEHQQQVLAGSLGEGGGAQTRNAKGHWVTCKVARGPL